MKSTHEPFDEELRRRLLNYTEEPNKHVWQNIVPRLDSVHPEPQWVVWTMRLSVILIGLSGIFYITDDVRNPMDTTVNQISSALADSSEAHVPIYPSTGAFSTKRLPASALKDTVNARTAGDFDQQERLSSLVADTRRRTENLFVKLSSNPALESREAEAEISNLTSSDSTAEPVMIHKRTSIEYSEGIKKSDLPGKEEPITPEKVERKRKPFSLYLTAMPTFGYQRIEAIISDNILVTSIERIPAFSFERLGVRLEAGVEIPITKRWKAFGGILYYQRKQTIGFTERWRDSVIVSTGPDGKDNWELQFKYMAKSIEYELKNVGLQAGISYQLWSRIQNSTMSRQPSFQKIPSKIKNKFLHEVGAGVEFHKSLREPRELGSAEGFSDPAIYVFVNMYYRLQYPNAGRLRAILQPTLNYSFYINENLNAPFYVKPYGLGLNFGCKYHFQ